LSITLAFDVYGTLIDTHGLVSKLEKLVGHQAENFSRVWREKQLEYSFRRGLMGQYQDFSACTSQALDYACLYHKVSLAKKQKDNLLEAYLTLPIFKDVVAGLTSLKAAGFRLYAFSNGAALTVGALLRSAGIRDMFIDVVSADEVKMFKPNPVVYEHFLKRAKASKDRTWLISSNSFDVIGAMSAGLNTAWLRRSKEHIFDPWELKPTITVESLLGLKEAIEYQQ